MGGTREEKEKYFEKLKELLAKYRMPRYILSRTRLTTF
jgi:hypothetical protein